MNCNAFCRICLQKGALYPIFQKEKEPDILSKISLCLHVTVSFSSVLIIKAFNGEFLK